MEQVLDLNSLISRLEVLFREHGNVPVTISVSQEDQHAPRPYAENRTILNLGFNADDNVMEIMA